MDAIVPPAGSNMPLIVEDDRRHTRSHVHVDIHDKRRDECADTARDMGMANLDATQQAGYHGVNNTNRVGDRISEGVDRAADNIDATMQRLGLHTLSDLHRASDKVASTVERFGLTQLESLKDTFATLRHDIAKETCSVKDKVCDGFRDSLLQAANNTAALQASIACNTKELLLQAADNHKDSQVTAMSNFKDLLLQAEKHARDAAECCCEVKELVRATGSKTDDLIRDIDRDNLREKVNSLKEELSILRMRASLVPPLVGAAAV